MSNCGCSRLWGCNEPIKRNQITSFLRMCTHSWMQSTSLGKHLGNPFFHKAIHFPDRGKWSIHCRRTRGHCEETGHGRRWSEAGNWAGCYLTCWPAYIFRCLFPGRAASSCVCCQHCSAALLGIPCTVPSALPLLGNTAHFLCYQLPSLLNLSWATTLTVFP